MIFRTYLRQNKISKQDYTLVPCMGLNSISYPEINRCDCYKEKGKKKKMIFLYLKVKAPSVSLILIQSSSGIPTTWPHLTTSHSFFCDFFLPMYKCFEVLPILIHTHTHTHHLHSPGYSLNYIPVPTSFPLPPSFFVRVSISSPPNHVYPHQVQKILSW